MASTLQSWLDRVYLVYFVLHIPILLCIDLVPFYPAHLWVPEGSPLHFLHDLRVFYITNYNDQFFALPPADVPSFFPLFAFFELVFHLPVSAWAVTRLAPAAGALDGPAELLLLVYGLQTALTTGTCMYEAWFWDAAIVTAAQKLVLLAGLYGSYLAIAIVLTVDMYARLLRRVTVPAGTSSAKKIQ